MARGNHDPVASDLVDPPDPGDRIDMRPRLALFVGIAAMALLPTAVTGTNLAFPEIENSFPESSRSTLSWALSGYSIVIAAFTLLGGELTDRIAGRRVFRVGLSIFLVASLVTAFAPGAGVLIAGRCLQGIGGALVVPSSLLVVTRAWPIDRRAFAVGIWTAAFPIGSALAPTMTAVVLEVASWRWVFGVTAVLALVVLVIESTLLPDPDRARRPISAAPGPKAHFVHPDYLGTAMGTGAVGLLALGIVQGPSWGWGSPRIVGILLAAAALVPAFIRRSRTHPRPLVDLDLFGIKTYAVASISNVLISIAGMSVWLIWPLLMANQWGYSQIRVGLAITPTPALCSVVAVYAAKLAPRIGFRQILLSGMALLLVANLWFVWRIDNEPDFLGAMLPGLVLYGVAMGLTFAPINAAALDGVPPETYGQANAAFNTGRFLAGAIGIAAVVAALGDTSTDPLSGYDRAFLLLAMTSAAGFVLLAATWPRGPLPVVVRQRA